MLTSDDKQQPCSYNTLIYYAIHVFYYKNKVYKNIRFQRLKIKNILRLKNFLS